MNDWAFLRKRKSDKLALLEQDLNWLINIPARASDVKIVTNNTIILYINLFTFAFDFKNESIVLLIRPATSFITVIKMIR